MSDDNRWHLDKKVPISIIFALFLQFFGGVWYVGRIESRVAQLEHDAIAQHERDARQDADAVAALALVRDDLKELNSKMDRILERESARAAR